jgi:adenylate cyclase
LHSPSAERAGKVTLMITPVLARWLADSGLRNLPLEELVDGFSRRLNEAGVPVARIFVGMNTLHPHIRARSLIWDRVTGPSTHFEFQHAEVDRAIIRQSPFATMLSEGIFEQRRKIAEPGVGDGWPVFDELRAAGMTEWLGCVFPFGGLALEVGDPLTVEKASQLWLVLSLTTDRPGGFDEAHVESLRNVLPLFALAVKGSTAAGLGRASGDGAVRPRELAQAS